MFLTNFSPNSSKNHRIPVSIEPEGVIFILKYCFLDFSEYKNYLGNLDVVINILSGDVVNWIVSPQNSSAETLIHSVIVFEDCL